jgi:hypothetical protein
MIHRYEPGDHLVWRHGNPGHYLVVPGNGSRVRHMSTTGTVVSRTTQRIKNERRHFCFVLVDGYGKTMLFDSQALERLK